MTPERWQKIESIFQAAIDLPAELRYEYVEQNCENDPDIRDEVLGLIRNLDSADDFIESPVWTDSSFLSSSARKVISDSIGSEMSADETANMVGRQIGAFRIESEIGRGGMGSVYLAERADGEFIQKVAIKLIKRGMDSDFIIRRFRYERQILASFEHPYIARLLDGGTLPDGVPYFVMEYIEGQTLYNYCDRHLMDIAGRLKLFQKVCSAIEYAHERQIIHRDIKPGNILINKYGNPKLLDFGIAKILDPDLIHESVNPTASLMRMMTPDYASPEQVKGEEVTLSSDIYSLGILLYELLTGHRPYRFEGRALHEVSRVICEVQPFLPSEVLAQDENLLPQYVEGKSDFLAVRSSTKSDLEYRLSGDLDSILMKVLAKHPAERYASAKDLAEDISSHMSGRPIHASGPKRNPRGSDFEHLAAASNTKSVAILPFRFLDLTSGSSSDERFLGLGLTDALISRLSKIRRFVVRPTNSVLSFGERPTDPIKAGRDLNVDYVLDGNIKQAKDRLRVSVQLLNVRENAAIWATSIDENIADVFSLEDNLSTKLIEVLLPQLTGSELAGYSKRGTENPEAFEHYLRGRYYFNTFTEDGLAKAFVSFHQAIAADPEYAHAYSGVADYYNWLGIIGVLPPQDCFQPAIEAATKAVELDDELSEAHASLGFSVHAGNHDWERAEFHLRRAIELNPGNANAYVWYSIVLCTEGRFTDALEFARRSIDLDPLTPFNHHNLGWILYFARRYEEAATQYKKVIATFPNYIFGYYGLSKIHRMTGEAHQSLEESEKVMSLMDDSVFAHLSHAEALAAVGEKHAAARKLAELEELSNKRYVSPYQLALGYCFLGENEKALGALRRAASIRESWLVWMMVEPAFDPIRSSNEFAELAENFSYRGFMETSFSAIRRTADPVYNSVPEADINTGDDFGNLTTLMIDGGSDTLETESDTANPVAFVGRRHLARIAISLAVLVGIVIGSAAVIRYMGDRSVPASMQIQTGNPTLLVLPFVADDPSDAQLGTGLADALSNRLGNIKGITLISANTGRELAREDLDRISSEMGGVYIVRGRLSRLNESQVIDAEMLAPGRRDAVWNEQFPIGPDGLAGVQRSVAEKIWKTLGIEPLPLEREQISKAFTADADAYQLYLIGRYQMANRSSENLRRSIDTFSSALKRDPSFSLAYVGLADAYALINLYDITPPKEAYPKALEYANKALAIDDDLAEAHASLAYIRFYYQRDHAGAELEFRRAVQMNPSYAQAHHWFALMLAAENRPVEALTEAQTAQRLDPRSPSIKAATAIVYFMDGKHAEALAECEKALKLSEGFVPALKVERWVYSALGDRPSAQAVFQKEMSYSGGSLDDPGWNIIELQLVPSNEDLNLSKARLAKAISLSPVRDNDFTFAFEIALAYQNLGDNQKALDWLERALAAGSHSISFINVDPRLAPLKTEARFHSMLKKLG